MSLKPLVTPKRLPTVIFNNQSKLKKVKVDKQLHESPIEQIEDMSLSMYNTEHRIDGHAEGEHIEPYKNIPEFDEKKMQQEKPVHFLDCLGILHQNHTDRLHQGKLYYQTESGTFQYKLCLTFIGDWEEHVLEVTDHNPSVCKPLKEMSHIPNYASLTEKYETLIKQKSGAVTRDMLSNSCNVFFCGNCTKPISEPAPEPKVASGCCSKESGTKAEGSGGCCSKESGTTSKAEGSGGCCSKESSITRKSEKSGGCCSSKPAAPKKDSCCGSKPKETVQSQSHHSGSSCSCPVDCVCKRLQNLKAEPSKTAAGECEETSHIQKFSGCLCSETISLKHTHGEGCGHPFIIHDGHIDYIVDGRLHHVHEGHCDDHGPVYIIRDKESPLKKDANNQLFGEASEEI